MGGTNLLNVCNVSKTFYKGRQAFHALSGVNFSLHTGEIVGIIGPNGAGKSTLLRMIATLLTPTEGSISLDGCNIMKDSDTARRKIGYVAVETGLYEQNSAYELLLYFGRVNGLSKKEAISRIHELAEKLMFTSFLHRKIIEFSTGTKQKISIARGFIHRPSLMILDEPTNGLDLLASHNVRETIKMMKDDGISVLLASHIMQDIVLCDRLIIMNEGKIVEELVTKDVLQNFTSIEQLYFTIMKSNRIQVSEGEL